MSESNITRVKAEDGSVLVYENGNLKEVITADGKRVGGMTQKKQERELRRQVIGEGRNRTLLKTVEVTSPKAGTSRTVFVHPLFDVNEEQAAKYSTIEHEGTKYGIKRCALRMSEDEAKAFISGLQRAFPAEQAAQAATEQTTASAASPVIESA